MLSAEKPSIGHRRYISLMCYFLLQKRDDDCIVAVDEFTPARVRLFVESNRVHN